MLQAAWDEIEACYALPGVDPATIKLFQELKASQSTHTKKEGNPHHYCVFFLPYDQELGQIYLGHHKKADDWISPGGHVEPGEIPSQTAIREMKEELGVDITHDQLTPFNLSVKPIDRPGSGCTMHYDLWYLVKESRTDYHYLKSEYYAAGWFSVAAGIKKITKNPDFAKIISAIPERSQGRTGVLS